MSFDAVWTSSTLRRTCLALAFVLAGGRTVPLTGFAIGVLVLFAAAVFGVLPYGSLSVATGVIIALAAWTLTIVLLSRSQMRFLEHARDVRVEYDVDESGCTFRSPISRGSVKWSLLAGAHWFPTIVLLELTPGGLKHVRGSSTDDTSKDSTLPFPVIWPGHVAEPPAAFIAIPRGRLGQEGEGLVRRMLSSVIRA